MNKKNLVNNFLLVFSGGIVLLSSLGVKLSFGYCCQTWNCSAPRSVGTYVDVYLHPYQNNTTTCTASTCSDYWEVPAGQGGLRWLVNASIVPAGALYIPQSQVLGTTLNATISKFYYHAYYQDFWGNWICQLQNTVNGKWYNCNGVGTGRLTC